MPGVAGVPRLDLVAPIAICGGVAGSVCCAAPASVPLDHPLNGRTVRSSAIRLPPMSPRATTIPSIIAHLARPRTVAQPRSMGRLSADQRLSEAPFRAFTKTGIR
jgi:hypothetical protein